MARTMRWDRIWRRDSTGVDGSTGVELDWEFAPASFGETYTRLKLGLQVVWHDVGAQDGPWHSTGAFGIIAGPAGLSSPPARPLQEANREWLWWQPLYWRGERTTFDISGNIFSEISSAAIEQLDVKAQRGPAPEAGLTLWAVTQWSPGLPVNTAVYRNMWISTGILEPA